jgi:MFS family permease
MPEKSIRNTELEDVLEELGMGRYQYNLLACCYWACSLTATMPMLITILILEYPNITSLQTILLGCAWNFGYLIGNSLFPLLVHRRGRAQPFKRAIVLSAIGAMSMTISGNIYVVCIGYFIVGLGTGGDNIIYSGYLLENLPPSKIKYFTLQGITWGIGAVIIIGVAILANIVFPGGEDNWRFSIGFVGLGNVVFCFLRYRLLDSPTHLYAIKDPRLYEVLEEIYKINKKPIPDLRARQLVPEEHHLELSPSSCDDLQSPTTVLAPPTSIGSIFKSPYLLCTTQFTISYCLLTYCNAGFYIALPSIISTSSLLQAYTIMIFQQLSTIPSLALCSWCMSTRLGRKYTSILFWSLTGGALIVLLFVRQIGLVIMCLCSYIMFMNAGYGSQTVYLSEVWSPELRFIGVGFVMSVSKLAGVVASIVVTQMAASGGVFMVVLIFGIFYFVVSALILPVPETRMASYKGRAKSKRRTAPEDNIEIGELSVV